MNTIAKHLIFGAALALPSLAMAGYGGMHEIESDWSDTSLGDMVFGALIVWGVYALWKRFF